MSAEKPESADGQLIPERVAEIAGQLSEAQDESRRRRLARQIPQLAGRSSQATLQGLQSGTTRAWQTVQSGSGAVGRRLRPARDVAAKGAASSRDAAIRGAQVTGEAARRGAQAGGSATWRGVRASGQWLTTRTLEMAPRIPVRSLATLQAQYPDRSTEELADGLISGAARASAGVGTAVGAAAAVPFIPTAPVELGVETLALVAIELKLVAELHEVYGMPAPGSGPQRMLAYTGSWAQRRGVRITSGGLALAVGSPLRRQLERRLLAKAGQSALALAPLLAGAAAGAYIDHHETRKLGNLIREDLRKRAADGPAAVR
jgi:hypothetical protein